MKNELKRYKDCPVCGTDMRLHDISGEFEGAEDRFKEEIELNRDQPHADFRDWLKVKRSELTKKINEMQQNCKPDNWNSVNHKGLILLSIWYNYIDNIDYEIQVLSGSGSGGILKTNKPCNSLTRARAFCILLLQDANKEPKHAGKKVLMEIVKNRFPEQSGKTIYDLIKIKGLSLENKGDYISDYEYGLKLFDDLKP